MRGLCPRAPGIYRFRAKVATGGVAALSLRPLSRRSSRIPALFL